MSIIRKTAEQLGIQDIPTIRKAEEFLRAFQARSSLRNLNDVAKTILCLDLASANSGIVFDKQIALKLSGLTKSLYRTNLHTIEKILELDKPLSVSELCVQFSCTLVKELAEEILDKYNSSDNKIKDINHPQYVAAAVYTACKIKHVKVQKQQFIEKSRLKPAQWKELLLEFEKFCTSFGIGSPRKRKNYLDKTVEDLAKDIESTVMIKKKETEEEVEDYEVWKKRILDQAYKALKRKHPT